jgi:hypothetical protein
MLFFNLEPLIALMFQKVYSPPKKKKKNLRMLSVVVYVLLGLVLLSMELHITTISQPNSRVTSRGLKSKSIVQLITSI